VVADIIASVGGYFAGSAAAPVKIREIVRKTVTVKETRSLQCCENMCYVSKWYSISNDYDGIS